MTDEKNQAIKLLENTIDLINREGVERLIVIVKNDNGTGTGWINIDTYSFGGMMMELAQKVAVTEDLLPKSPIPTE